ncbi:ubiquitin carboxyl-terminal hydrolase 2 isoform X2 [Onthophagus taurus]|uniref:ubiquitin carboxyl-terminal hydrolase 2 isoform X2 n=1 Tax=Onthophagus taurus TaxID=166361 RepID=UPI0039BE62F2
MPVLSPHRNSVTGAYRSSLGSSSLNRYPSSTYTPNFYYERYSTRSYTDTDGRRIFSRSGSITEDGKTTRFYEESCDGNLSTSRRESLSRDSGIGSIRENSILESRRENSLTRDPSNRYTQVNVVDSLSDLRSKYSPANYVPAIHRNKHTTTNQDRISRSKSINDIGKPPPPTTNQEKSSERSEKDLEVRTGVKSKTTQNKDLSTSQPLNSRTLTRNNATASTSSSSSSANNNRVSLERDEEKIYDRKQTLLGGASQGGGLNGLKNIGNTCFMNSVIQCLSNTKPLLEYLRKDQYANEINTSISSMKGALIKAFAQVTKELWSEDSMDRVVNTVSLKSQIQRFAPRFMGYAQQDAQEFLRYLLEGLHEDVNRVTSKPAPIHTEIDEKLSDSEKSAESWQRYLRMDNSKIVDIFVGQLKSTLKCTHCGHCSVTFDPFWDLSLPIPQKVGPIRLQQCLDSFTREETLDGDEKPTCSKCKERRKCTKSFTIQKFPKILVIHLKRFSPMERFRGKLSVTVDFPLEGLDMSNYAADNRSQSRYNLYAISNHSGTTYSGHYTAYCRHPYSQSWHEYNDSRVCLISPKNIISGEAYVLFYELDGQKSHL